MHICDHHIKVYYNIEKRKLVKIEIEIYRGEGGQKFIGGTEICRGGQKWTTDKPDNDIGWRLGSHYKGI